MTSPSVLCSCGRGVIVDGRCSACGAAGGFRGLSRAEYLRRLSNVARDDGTVSEETEQPAEGRRALAVVIWLAILAAFGVGFARFMGVRL